MSPRAAEVAMKARETAITSPDGRLTLLQGDVRFTDVNFGYNPDKPVLHDSPGSPSPDRRSHWWAQPVLAKPPSPI